MSPGSWPILWDITALSIRNGSSCLKHLYIYTVAQRDIIAQQLWMLSCETKFEPCKFDKGSGQWGKKSEVLYNASSFSVLWSYGWPWKSWKSYCLRKVSVPYPLTNSSNILTWIVHFWYTDIFLTSGCIINTGDLLNQDILFTRLKLMQLGNDREFATLGPSPGPSRLIQNKQTRKKKKRKENKIKEKEKKNVE